MIYRTFIIFIALFCVIEKAYCQPSMLTRYKFADSLFRAGQIAASAPLLWRLINEPVTDSIKAESLLRYGLCQQNFNKYDSGIIFLKQSGNLFSSAKNKIKLSRVYMNIGDLYIVKKNYNEAKFYFKAALENAQLPRDSVQVYIKSVVMHDKQDHYDTVYTIITTDLYRYPPNIVPTQTYYISSGLAAYYTNKLKLYDSALYYLQIAAASSAIVSVSQAANVYRNIAETYMEMKQYDKAFLYMDSSIKISKNEGLAEDKLYDFDTYAELYERTHNYKKALQYSKSSRHLSDSFFDADKNTAMIDAEAKYQNQLALARNANLEKDKAITQRNLVLAENDNVVKQRNLVLTFIALGVVALLAFLAFRNTRIKQKANLLLTQQKQQVQELADQLAVANDTKARLFSTIGHDLRSPVSSLYASLKMQELKGNTAGGEMSEQTVRLLDTLEELLIWSKSQMDGFKVQPVKVNVRYFFEDLSAFYTTAAQAKNISIINDTAKEVVIRADENLLKTIFRNAISNAIANTSDEGFIRLAAIQTTDGETCMSITNPCCQESFLKFKDSFDDAAVKSGAYGLGIVLMKEFAQKLGGQINLVYTDGHASMRLCV